LRTELLDYDLPDALIALHPPKQRDGGRLLVLRDGAIEHRMLSDLVELVPPSALLVLNDTRVFRARLLSQRPGGGRAELLLLRRVERIDATAERWLALGKPAKRLRAGMRLRAGELEVEIEGRGAEAELSIVLSHPLGVEAALEQWGHVPIPPYLRREDVAEDATRYQTVFARHLGSVAAPTAGLHLTEQSLDSLRRRAVEIAHVTLHVGPGTFKPVTADELDAHDMHSEQVEVSAETARAIERARERRSPVVAVGTTVVRALESAHDPDRPGHVRPMAGETRLLIQPGYEFGVVDALLTNFHMPRSTLLALVAAFAGLDSVLAAYRDAVAREYRFLSYGDAMWIPDRRANA